MVINLLGNIKVIICLISFVAFYSCSSTKDLKIVPISPYEYVSQDEYKVQLKTVYFAVDGFKYNRLQKDSIDKFVLNKLDSMFVKDNSSVEYLFFKYEKGKIDENYKMIDVNSKHNNIMWDAGTLLVAYHWLHGKFIAVTYFDKRGKPSSEERNW